MFRRPFADLLGAVVLYAAVAPADAAPASPAAVIETLHAAVASAATDAAGGARTWSQREPLVTPAFRRAFAFRTMAELRLGAAWARLTPAQQTQVAQGVAGLVTYELARPGRPTAWGAPASTQQPDGSVTVRVTSRDGQTSMHYRMQPFDGDWLAVDYGKGPRASANTESAPRYQALLRSGFGDLIEWLEENAEPDEGPPTGYSPTQVIKRLQDALIGVMRDAQRLGYAGRYQRLERIVKETHYIPAIARLTVRRYWDQLSTEQKRELVTTFGELSVANYASKFDGFSGERFQQLGEEKSGKSTIVRTQIVKSNGEAVPLDYTMREVKGRWRILNITADGVSDLSTKQAEYGSVMASGGFSALIARLEDQIRRYGG